MHPRLGLGTWPENRHWWSEVWVADTADWNNTTTSNYWTGRCTQRWSTLVFHILGKILVSSVSYAFDELTTLTRTGGQFLRTIWPNYTPSYSSSNSAHCATCEETLWLSSFVTLSTMKDGLGPWTASGTLDATQKRMPRQSALRTWMVNSARF